MGIYSNDRKWSDLYIPAIKQIVGPYLLVESPILVDQKQAADLITLEARGLTIACRVRRPGYAGNYGYQFTIRCHRDSGAETELSKIINGWGDWMFYAHASSDDPDDGFKRWLLLNLSHFRAHMIRREEYKKRGEPIFDGKMSNNDGTYFAYFDVRTFPDNPPLLIAASEPIPSADGQGHCLTSLPLPPLAVAREPSYTARR